MTVHKLNKDFIIRWSLLIALAVLVGVLAGILDAGFGHILGLVTNFRQSQPSWFLLFLPLAGIVVSYCYQAFGKGSVRGIHLIFEAGHGQEILIPRRLISFSIIGTWVTHLFGGSAGREGVAIQIGGTIGQRIAVRFKRIDLYRPLIIVGMAAGFSGLFQTPIAATFFAMEVLTVGKLEYRAFIPAIIASYTSTFISSALGLHHFHHMLGSHLSLNLMNLLRLIALGLVFGIMGKVFSILLKETRIYLARRFSNPYLRTGFVGLILALMLISLWSGRYSGLGLNLIQESFDGTIRSFDFAFKSLMTILTLAIGLQGGEVTPLFSIGASLGAYIGPLFGVPFTLAAALGYIAVFGSATRTLFTPIFIGIELFGFSCLPYYLVVCIFARLTNPNHSIYTSQRKKSPIEEV